MADSLTVHLEGIHVSRLFTVRAADVAQFALISGDDYEAHTDAEFMARSSYGQCIAHGAFLVGYMSAVGTMAIRAAQKRGNQDIPVSLGYERMRFVAPVFFGEEVSATYSVKSVDEERRRSIADVAVAKSDGTVVAVAEHIMKWLHTDAHLA